MVVRLVLKYSFSGYISRPTTISGRPKFLATISIAAFSKELKGLSKTMQCTFLCSFFDWLNTIEAPPIDLPHNTNLEYERKESR